MRKTIAAAVVVGGILMFTPNASADTPPDCVPVQPGTFPTGRPCQPSNGETCDQAWVDYYHAILLLQYMQAEKWYEMFMAEQAKVSHASERIDNLRIVRRHQARVIRRLRARLAAAQSS